MSPLEPPDTHHLSAALGWLGLGNIVEAKAELARVRPGRENQPEVLEVRWAICAEEKQWPQALEIARALVRSAPDSPTAWLHQAYALRRVPEGGVQSAWEALLPAFDKFPREPIISYNLSCYACQLNKLDAARLWLQRALVIGGKEKIKKMAMQDTDLKPLWAEIKDL